MSSGKCLNSQGAMNQLNFTTCSPSDINQVFHIYFYDNSISIKLAIGDYYVDNNGSSATNGNIIHL